MNAPAPRGARPRLPPAVWLLGLTSLFTDMSNCLSCGTVCATPTNGVASCNATGCGLGACNPGFSNCDGDAGNGCERNTATDASNCGGCGVVCGGAITPEQLGGHPVDLPIQH